MRSVLICVLSGIAYGGQSLILSTGSVNNPSVAAQTANHACQIVVSFHDWDSNWNPFVHTWDAPPCGFSIYTYNVGGDLRLIVQDDRTAAFGGVTCQLALSALATKFVTLRFQRIPSGAGGTNSCEAFDISGNAVNTFGPTTGSYTGTDGMPNSSGVTVFGTGSGQNLSTAYYRLYSTTVLPGSKPPLTSDRGDLLEWAFDLGNNTPSLTDLSGNGYNGTLTGPDSFVATPGQSLVKAAIQFAATFWAPMLSMKAGVPNTLDGTQSYTQADSGSLTYLWTRNSGPNAPSFSSTTAAQPVFGPSATFAVFGNYNISLKVDDGTNNNTSAFDIGAVNYDINGVVINSDPNVEKVFGKQIAFGQNPWAYADERNKRAIDLQIANNPYFATTTWTTKGVGTIDYPLYGKGGALGQQAGTILTAPLMDSDTTIHIADARKLSLLILPTWITLGIKDANPPTQEMARIQACKDDITTGPCDGSTVAATLTVAYDGRGMSAIYSALGDLGPAKAWNTGDPVGEMKVLGHSTLFATDSNRPLAPGGLPGPIGPVVAIGGGTATSGTVAFTPNSSTISISGFTFMPAMIGDSIRAAPTHGGTPWTWWARMTGLTVNTQFIGSIAPGVATLTPTTMMGITNGMTLGIDSGVLQENVTVTSTTATTFTATFANNHPFAFIAVYSSHSVVVNRRLPSDVDATAVAFKVIGPRYAVLEFSDTNSDVYRFLSGVYGCESETACYGSVTYELAGFINGGGSTSQVGQKYSYKDALSAQSAFGPNFYGTGLAARMFYYRSGYGPALTLANQIDENWVKDPELCGGWGCNGSPLLIGGGLIGAFADVVLNGSTALTWRRDMQNWAEYGISGIYGSVCQAYAYVTCTAGGPTSCVIGDTRDTGYAESWLALGGLFDPDSTRHNRWTAGLLVALTRDQKCRRNASDGYSGVEINSFANTFNFGYPNQGGPAITLTTGSAAGTGVGFNSLPICAGQATGTITVTQNLYTGMVMTITTGALSADDLKIWISDGAGYTGAFEYSFSGSTVNLAGSWGGQSGTFPFMTESNSLAGEQRIRSIWYQNLDSYADNQGLKQSWACFKNSDTSITLDRPWTGPTRNDFHKAAAVVDGLNQQPYMLGIKTTAMNWAAQVSDGTVAAGFTTLIAQTGQWMASYGIDSNTRGTYYARVNAQCETGASPSHSPGPIFLTITGLPGCGWSGLATTTGGEYTERAATPEAGSALLQYFISNPAPGLAENDIIYGAVYGNCQYTSGGGLTYYCDAHYVNTQNELGDGSIGGYKWTGFFFGVGGLFSSGWPALRTTSLVPAVHPLLRYTGLAHPTGGAH